jgi:hypothetical protein
MTIELLGADYHRNGIGGAGFYVALFKTPEEPNRTFIAVMFVDRICARCGGTGIGAPASAGVECPTCKGTGEVWPTHVETTAVLDVAQAVGGNIYMHPEYAADGGLVALGGNAWRGADYYGPELLPLIRAWLEQSEKNADAHWAKETVQKALA